MGNSIGTKRPAAMLALVCAMLAAVLAVSLSAPASALAATKATLSPGKTAKITLYADSATQNAATLKVAGKKAAKGVWKSSKKKVATVAKGKVKAKKPGKTNITAKFGKKTYKASVTVKAVSISQPSAVLTAGGTLALALDGDEIQQALSSNLAVATVSLDGRVTAKSAGQATITLLSKKGNPYTCNVTVNAASASTPAKPTTVAVTGVKFAKTELSMKTGDEPIANPATVTPANATNKMVTYSSSDEDVATVDGKGNISPVGPGSATITAKTVDGGKTDTCTVEVEPGTITAASTKAVKKALQSGYDYDAVVLSTNASSVNLNMTGGDEALAEAAANTELVVDAPNASVDNYDKWGKVTVEAISPNTYTEHSDNFICMRPANGRLVVAEGGRASIEADESVQNLIVENNGTIDKLDVGTEGTVEVSGTSDQEAIPTELNAAGTVKASVVLQVVATVKATIVLYPGSEGTTAEAASDAVAPTVEGIGTVSFTIRANGAAADMKTIVADYSENVATGADTATATLRGTVRDQESALLAGAQVQLYPFSSSFSLAKRGSFATAKPATTTDADGAYSFAGVKAGNYIVVASKSDFSTVAMNVYLANVDGDAYSPEIVMVPGEDTGEGTIAGQVIDSAEQGNVGIPGITLRAREGLNNITGGVLQEAVTDSKGNYEFAEPFAEGAYTVEAVDLRNNSDSFYISTHFNVNVFAGQQSTAGVGLTKAVSRDEVRFILHWNDEASGAPSDLDSHLLGPDGSGGLFHVYFSDRTFYEGGSYGDGDEDNYIGGTLMADLDRDDTDWEGPETTTIRKKSAGTYHYFVHDYSNRESGSSSEMSTSGAYVEVYSGATRVRTFYVPANEPGTVWYVCTYDPATGAIAPVNTMGFESDASSVGSDAIYGDLRITSLAKNDFVKDYKITGSRIVIETNEDMAASKASLIVPTIAKAGAKASVVYDEDEGWVIKLADTGLTRTYRLSLKKYYGDLKITGFNTNGVITDYWIDEDSADYEGYVELTSTTSDFTTYKNSVVPVIAEAGATYALENDEEDGVTLTIRNAAGTLTRSYRVYVTRDWGGLQIASIRSLDESVVTDVDLYSSGIDIWTTLATFDESAFNRYLNVTYGSAVASHGFVDDDGELYLELKGTSGETRRYSLDISHDWGSFCITGIEARDESVTDTYLYSESIEIYSTATLTAGNFDSMVNVIYGSAVASHQVVERDGELYLALKNDAGETREYYVSCYRDWGDLYIDDIDTSQASDAISWCDWANNIASESWIEIALHDAEPTVEILNSLEILFDSDTISGSWSQDSGSWVYTITDSANPGISRVYHLRYQQADDED